MLYGKFNELLKEYDNETLRKAYTELQFLEENGEFPVEHNYFIELCHERRRLYKTEVDIEATRRDLLAEIARRWYEQGK